MTTQYIIATSDVVTAMSRIERVLKHPKLLQNDRACNNMHSSREWGQKLSEIFKKDLVQLNNSVCR